MSVDIVDVEKGDVEGLVVAVSGPIIVTVTATFGFKSVDVNAVVASDHCGVGRGRDNGREKERSELHGGPTERSDGRTRRREEPTPKKKRKVELGDIYLEVIDINRIIWESARERLGGRNPR